MNKTIKNFTLAMLPIAIAFLALFATSNYASAAACTNTNNYGSATATVNVPATGDYRIWSRIKVPSTSASTYQLEADNNTCWQVGGANVPVNVWTWVDWYGGNSSQKVNYTFSTTGNHTLKFIGAATNVQVDKVILLGTTEKCSDGGTTPTGDGANCASAPAPPSISSFSANPATVIAGASTTFNWATINTSSCSVTPGGPTNTTSVSWMTLAFTTTGTKTYTLTCTNATGASTTATTNVIVNAAPTPPNNVLLSASSTSVTSGTLVKFTWSSNGGTSCTLNPGNYTASGSSSSANVAVTSTTTFTAQCSNSAGSTNSPSVTVTVVATPPPPANPVINSFTANPTNVSYNGVTKLTWSSSNVTTNGCVLNSTLNGTPVSYPASSEYSSAALTASVAYTLTCKNSAGLTTSKSVSIIVADKPAPPAPAPTPTDQIPSTPGGTTENGTTKVVAPSGEQVVSTQDSAIVNKGDLATLDTSNITDKVKIDSILRVEFYNGEELIQTVDKAPFALDTNKLSPGNHTITQRTYFKDGTEATQSQLIEVKGAQDVQSASATKIGGAQSIVIGIGSLLALVVAAVSIFWYVRLRPQGYALRESFALILSPFKMFASRALPRKTSVTPPTDVDKGYYAEPTVITPDNKEK